MKYSEVERKKIGLGVVLVGSWRVNWQTFGSSRGAMHVLYLKIFQFTKLR
jgi:hypothetical protein